jgi:RNA polymerase sigma factor (sigma-70 family)
MWNDQQKKSTSAKAAVDNAKHSSDLISEQEFLSEIEHENQFKLAEKVITELGERCREILILFYFRSLSLKTIASKMGYNSEATAKNQKYKCLESAKNKLKAYQNEKI